MLNINAVGLLQIFQPYSNSLNALTSVCLDCTSSVTHCLKSSMVLSHGRGFYFNFTRFLFNKHSHILEPIYKNKCLTHTVHQYFSK